MNEEIKEIVDKLVAWAEFNSKDKTLNLLTQEQYNSKLVQDLEL